MPRRHLSQSAFLLLSLALGYQTIIFAADPTTLDVILLSGGQSDNYWQEKDKVKVSGWEGYFALGSISLASRSTHADPINIEIWGRGLSKLHFFDLTPLVDALAGQQSSQAIRALFLPPATKDSTQGTSDRDKLELVLAQNKPGKDAALAWKRQVVYEQMILLKLTSFDELWPIYQQQLDFVSKSGESELKPETVLSLYGLNSPAVQGKGDASEVFSNFIRTLNDNKLLVPILRTKLARTTEPRQIGYLLQFPEGGARKTSGQISVAANGLSPETMLVNLETERQESIFYPWSTTKFLAAILTPTITGLAGTLLGAVIGYLGFLAQQNHSRTAEAERKFEEKKVENSVTIRRFFKEEYPGYLAAESDAQERKNVSAIRDSFIELGIYAILPRREAREFSSICNFNRRFAMVGGRLKALRSLLERRFGDLMI